VVANCGSYFTTILDRTKLKIGNGKEKKRRQKLHELMELYRNTDSYNNFFKKESTQVKFQEQYKLVNHFFLWIPILVEPPTIIEDVMSCFNWIHTI